MKQNIISLIIIAFGAICVAQLTIQITNQCECSQFSQNSCGTQYSDQSCQWNTTSQTCVRKGCQSFNTQNSCLQNFVECYWNGKQCKQFTSCSQLTYQNLTCSQQNIQCGSFTSNSTSCLQLDELPQCSSLNQNQCTPQQIAYQGTLCFWNTSAIACQTAQSCAQLEQQSDCIQWANNCKWNSTSNQCVQLQCSSFTTQSTCTYVLQGFNSQIIIPCQFVQGQCQPIQTARQLGAQNCSSSTLSTYQWIQSNNTGVCIPCMYSQILNQYQPNNKCSCSSLLSQQCESSSYCYWSSNECNTQVCNQITDQLSCIENLECSWNTNNSTCSTFQFCPGGVMPREQCLESSFNCLFYNYTSNYCSPLSNHTCSHIYNQYQCQNSLGYCNWNGYQCIQVEQCKQITEQRLCYRFGYSCTWLNGQCQQLTCNKIQQQNQCIYTIPQLYTNDVQPCIWQNNQCLDLQNTNSLNAEQCQQKSLDTFKWTGSSCVSCSQVKYEMLQTLQLPNQCECNQFFTQQQCQQNSNCFWSGIFCQPQLCQNIITQSSCASNPNCAWVDFQCQSFKSCDLLKGRSQSDCIVLSVNCPESNGTNCLDKKSLKACSSFVTQSACQNVLGNDGMCFWQSSSCQVLSKCQQITSQQDCSYFSKQCYWSTSCQPVSCSIFTSISNCQFYFTSINSINPVPCYWNSTQGVCTQTTDYMTQLNSEYCQTNTNNNARWSQTLKVCLSCKAPMPPNPKQCSCVQLISQYDCIQNQQCLWNGQTNTCSQLPCKGLTQSLCIQNSQCMWNTFCQPFTVCTDLKATTSEECAAQSLYCPYYNSNTKQCQAASKSEIPICSSLNQQQCNIQKPPYYVCQWNYSLNECQAESYCTYIYHNSSCFSNYYCYFDGTCKPKLCQHYVTKEQCTFVINPQNWNYVQSCAWLDGACVTADNLYSQQTCFSNTDQTARWSSNIKDGLCIPCNLPLQQVLPPKNQCLCSQLQNQYDCEQGYCEWDSSGYCYDVNCGKLYSQTACIQNLQCFWNNKNGFCSFIQSYVEPYTKDPCTKLSGNNSLECLSQSLFCPVSLNGVCQNRALLQTCQSMSSLQLCSNSIGQEGYCTYENQQCKVLTTCSQLKTLNDCVIFSNSCYFNSATGICEQLLCSSYQTQQDCTYIFQNINKSNIQMCEWNQKSKTCSSGSYIIQQTFQNCYKNTAGTYHWTGSSSTKGSCVSCSLNMIQPKNTCSCTLLNQVECMLSQPVCKLNQNNQCVKSQCNEILDSVHCSQQNECMWKLNQCVTFTKCTDLNGLTSLDCAAQSLQCQLTLGGICQSQSTLSPCDKYYTPTSCTFGKQGSDGFCYFNTAKQLCQVISSCDKVDNLQVCQSLKPACQWSYFFSSCVPFQCQDYTEDDDCTHVIVNLQDPQIELCVWQNYKCVPFIDTYYRFDDAICYINSDHTYRWVKEDKFGVRCQQCLQGLLISIIAIILLLFI